MAVIKYSCYLLSSARSLYKRRLLRSRTRPIVPIHFEILLLVFPKPGIVKGHYFTRRRRTNRVATEKPLPLLCLFVLYHKLATIDKLSLNPKTAL